MGDSGDVSGWSRDLYESLQSDEAIDSEIQAIRRAIAKGRGSRVRKRIEAVVIGGALLAAAKASLRRERHVSEVLSKNADVGLTSFLSGPVSTQIAEEIGAAHEVAFVFGHTHKPFVERRQATGLPGDIPVINTGGWVVDTPAAEPNKGASVVLIDEDLNVAILRCYVQGADLDDGIRMRGSRGRSHQPSGRRPAEQDRPFPRPLARPGPRHHGDRAGETPPARQHACVPAPSATNPSNGLTRRPARTGRCGRLPARRRGLRRRAPRRIRPRLRRKGPDGPAVTTAFGAARTLRRHRGGLGLRRRHRRLTAQPGRSERGPVRAGPRDPSRRVPRHRRGGEPQSAGEHPRRRHR